MKSPLQLLSAPGCYQTLRSLHLYTGLFISPLVLVFAASVLVINHWHPVSAAKTEPVVETRRIESIPEHLDSLEAVHRVMAQADLSGWVTFFKHLEPQNQLRFVLLRPTVRRNVALDLETGMLEIKHQPNDLAGTLVWLHVFPGPHTQHKNWFFTFLWWVLADGVAYGVIFLSVTGIYLWVFLRAERRIGLLLITLGLVSLALILTPLLR